jgi:hypothetical protein
VLREAVLTEGGESGVCLPLDGIVKLAANDVSHPWHHGVQGYLHPDLTNVLTMGLKWMAVVEGNIPVVAEADKCIPQHF